MYVLLLIVSVAGRTLAGSLPMKPNIILILTDDQGYGDLSLHGNPILKTPNMDLLGSTGVRFDNFVVSPSCSPTRCALLTGMYPFKSGVTHTIQGRERMSLKSVTLPQVLKRGGYTTGMFGKWHLGMSDEFLPQNRGFDVAVMTQGDSQNSHFNPTLVRNGKPEEHEGFRTDILFNEAMRFMKSNKDGPFFCYLSTYSPHAPLKVPEQYKKPFEGKVSDEEATFLGMVSNIDENIGRLLAYLDESGLRKNTLVILVNDNGGTYGVDVWNAHMRGHKGGAWNGSIRALSFWNWKGQLKPSVVNDLAGHIDVLPTLAEIAGVSLEEDHRQKLDGFSLVPMLEGEPSPDPERIIIHHLGRWFSGQGDMHQYAMCGVRYKNFHMVRSTPCQNEYCRGECRFVRRIHIGSIPGTYSKNGLFHFAQTPFDRWALFDVSRDVSEEHDIAEQNPQIVARLALDYDLWWEKVSADFPRMTEITFTGKLEQVGHGKVYRLTTPDGKVIPLEQPGLHEPTGWTRDRVPDLATFSGKHVEIKALAFRKQADNELDIWRVTKIESPEATEEQEQ